MAEAAVIVGGVGAPAPGAMIDTRVAGVGEAQSVEVLLIE